MGLDLVPDAKAVGRLPDLRHLGPAVAWNHVASSRLRCPPDGYARAPGNWEGPSRCFALPDSRCAPLLIWCGTTTLPVENGSASCRDRVCQNVLFPVVDGA